MKPEASYLHWPDLEYGLFALDRSDPGDPSVRTEANFRPGGKYRFRGFVQGLPGWPRILCLHRST
jgi:hypothetical protein